MAECRQIIDRRQGGRSTGRALGCCP